MKPPNRKRNLDYLLDYRRDKTPVQTQIARLLPHHILRCLRILNQNRAS
jgi:hypothetical protein